jgi:hypothetical protein
MHHPAGSGRVDARLTSIVDYKRYRHGRPGQQQGRAWSRRTELPRKGGEDAAEVFTVEQTAVFEEMNIMLAPAKKRRYNAGHEKG